jgi:hypothetical protein
MDSVRPVHAPGHVPDLAPARDLSDYRLCRRDDAAMKGTAHAEPDLV